MSLAIIGAGRVGSALAQRSEAAGTPAHLLTRDSGWDRLDPTAGSPILVATRNDDLDAVVSRVPAARHRDLVFVQNGMLRPWLEARGLAGATRGLLFFAVPRRGDPVEPGGTSPFHGPHAAEVAQWLGKLGLEASALSASGFAALELEKLIWNAAFGLLCERFSADVGTVVTEHRQALEELTAEMLRVGGPSLGVELALAPLVDRLAAYSLTIPRYRGAVKEWRWRNGWFVDQARAREISTPRHDEWLAATGHLPQEPTT